jgi:uncharacterized protein with PIN domain
MEEDVLGPRRQVLRRNETRCAKCGRPVPRARAPRLPMEEPEEVRTEEVTLCPSCRDVVPTDKVPVEVEEGAD